MALPPTSSQLKGPPDVPPEAPYNKHGLDSVWGRGKNIVVAVDLSEPSKHALFFAMHNIYAKVMVANGAWDAMTQCCMSLGNQSFGKFIP